MSTRSILAAFEVNPTQKSASDATAAAEPQAKLPVPGFATFNPANVLWKTTPGAPESRIPRVAFFTHVSHSIRDGSFRHVRDEPAPEILWSSLAAGMWRPLQTVFPFV